MDDAKRDELFDGFRLLNADAEGLMSASSGCWIWNSDCGSGDCVSTASCCNTICNCATLG